MGVRADNPLLLLPEHESGTGSRKKYTAQMLRRQKGKGMKKYYDKNGTVLKEGDFIKFPDGIIKKLYLTDKDQLGIDATNPEWIKRGKAFECEFGIYPLESFELDQIEKVKV